MKNITFLITLLTIVSVNQAIAKKNILSDTIVWSGSITLDTNQLITSSQTLKILPGTTVTATGMYKIEIQGNVIAEGTEDDPILFTAIDTVGLCDSAIKSGGWHGIHLVDNSNGKAYFSNCCFEYGKANIPGSWYDIIPGFVDENIGNQGGALWVQNYYNVSFIDCLFQNNYARSRGGAIYCHDIQSVYLCNCNFILNKVLVMGGAIYIDKHHGLEIDSCTFKQNTTWCVSESGSIFNHGSAVCIGDYPPNGPNIIKNCYFFNNKSLSAIADFSSGSKVANNVFANNFNLRVIAFNRRESSNLVINNTIANNYYKSGIPGVYSYSLDLQFYNNILWNNFSDSICENDMALTWHFPPDVQYCLVWDGRIDGENIITDDPLFVNPAPNYGLESNGWEYNWSLLDESPAVNAGIPDTTGLNLPPYDIVGNPRVFGNRIDIGAYENQNVYVKVEDGPVCEKTRPYPNPGTNLLNIKTANSTYNFELINFSGNIIASSTITGVSNSINTSNLASGIYFYRLLDVETGKVETGKWIKR